jgi:hypothetical protein
LGTGFDPARLEAANQGDRGMKKIILTAVLGTAALGLAACDNAADDVDESTTIVTEEPAVEPAPVVTETAVVEGDADVDVDVDEPDVEATIGPDPSATIRAD